MTSAKEYDRADGLRITMQYHSRKGMVYELEKAGLALDVHVTPEQIGETVEAGRQWIVGAQSSREKNAVVITERAPTRAEALRRVGQTWTACARERNLPLFDWSAVERVLLSVRAL